MTINRNKSLILLRGLPGSGKSTLSEVLSEKGRYPVFSIDSYFTDPDTGAYNFEYKNNHLAYKRGIEQTRLAMTSEIEKIFIDNTFTMEWEIEPYINLASELGYTLFVVTVEKRHKGKNIHGVSDEQLRKMAEKYNVVLL